MLHNYADAANEIQQMKSPKKHEKGNEKNVYISTTRLSNT